MDNILKLNPNQKFYISSDLPDEIMGYFYEKYGDNLIDKKNILNIVYDYIVTSGIKKSELEYGNVVPNLVDLFSLLSHLHLVLPAQCLQRPCCRDLMFWWF